MAGSATLENQETPLRQASFGILILFWLCTLAACSAPRPAVDLEANLHQGNYAPPPAALGDSLTVVSYNIAFAKRIEAALADLRAHPPLVKPDILLLQEMDTPGARKIARALEMNYVYLPSYVHPEHAKTFGIAVLSPWPVVASQALVMPHGDPATGHRRKALAVDLRIGPHLVRAVSVHLSTMIVPQAKRLEQAQTVVDSLCAVDYPVIVAGDFNSATEYDMTLFARTMRKGGFRLARLPAGPTADGGVFNRVGPALVLDHIFYRGFPKHGQTGRLEDVLGSDHLPIWARLPRPR